MCGIVGYIGSKQACPILLDGLSKLEYRGYDSAGVAIYNGGSLEVEKARGRLQILRDITENGKHPAGSAGIGHTRWSTHGRPSDVNSHPQTSGTGNVAVVHNGIIENYLELKEMLISAGVKFVSETDTEVIAHLFERYYKGDLLETAETLIQLMEGSYALGIICLEHPDKIVAIRKESPLIIGIGSGESFIASDVTAILNYTRDIYYIEDKEIAIVSKDSIEIYDMFMRRVNREAFHVDWDVEAAEKGGYEHFMLKEIMEQPKAVLSTVSPRIKKDRIDLGINLTSEDVKKIKNIYVVACGSAYYAGVTAKYIFSDMLRIPCTAQLASEFRYENPMVGESTLVVIISQSGETADSVAALREAKRLGAKVLSIVNVVGSTISKESDYLLYTWAGPEIAVATTKAYSTQLSCIYLLGLYMSEALGLIEGSEYAGIIGELKGLPEKIEAALGLVTDTQLLASRYFNAKNIFFIGRNIDYAICLEGSLKLKEISYTMSEAYAAGELKHGTISLIEEGTPVVALMTTERLFDKMLSNIKEVKARGASVIAIVNEDARDISGEVDHVLRIPRINASFYASLAVVPLQLFAYYIASMKGCDIDKPRNLAKSVTVE
ncbi:MAG: glutamine--fructose-6-phosphate transaminase (isomerizing) [Oscillospiraceae bacterium]|jgi:glucosamine--fructose-6-phosphate aminotransferase (isomerizing)|nr:glutamine--fructose-6-phosphate transaminase (isomerizing) [Oscillospiraceae bacterium]